MKAEREFEEIEVQLDSLSLRGRMYGEGNSKPLLALHGWLDNCASFSFLAPLLVKKDFCILALDLAGHGLSDHRSHEGAYNIWQDISELALAVEELNWSRFSLLGHSRGAMIAALFAACCPERITQLGLIDGVAPEPLAESEVLQQLRKAVKGTSETRKRKRNYYRDFSAAVKAREEGFTALCHQDALVLAERGVNKDDVGYYWNSDPKLSIPSEVKFTENQIKHIMGGLAVEPTLILAESGLEASYPQLYKWVSCIEGLDLHNIPGDHHLHMSGQAVTVAKILADKL